MAQIRMMESFSLGAVVTLFCILHIPGRLPKALEWAGSFQKHRINSP